ncbi:MAG TPA: MFS transporter, partial [Parvularculaceae bacterium]|nr:MFS transporter [Parvularculaceae bacterium]
IVHALLPVFLTTTLGASVAAVGVIDGVAEATASISKVFSGWLSDRFHRRKPLILLGYGLAALAKPLFPLASGPSLVLAARFMDRIGKGLRGAPRDALIADATSLEIRGRAYGLRQALDTAGALAGPLAAIGLMALSSDNIPLVFWVAVIPAWLAVAAVLIGVREAPHSSRQPAPPLRLGDIRRLGRPFLPVLTIGVLFAMARFSEAFLVLRAVGEGLSLTLAPLAFAAMNAVYALGAYPAGALADRWRARDLLLAGLGVLILADLVLAFPPGLAGVFSGVALWGAHMALTQGLLSKLVAASAPDDLRASAFGVFNLASGLAALLASIFAGLAWTTLSPGATFLIGAGFSALALPLVYFARGR